MQPPPGANRLVLSPTVTVVDAEPAIVFIGERRALRVECGEWRWRLLDGLARSPLLSDWLTGIPPRLAAAMIRALRDSRFLAVDGEEGPPAPEFAGNEGWFALHGGEPAAARERLRTRRVAILGVGGLGSHVLRHLAGMGVGHFVLVDGDRVELGNLNRQYLYSRHDVGRPKVGAAADAIRRCYPTIDVTPIERMIERSRDLECLDDLQPDLLVCAADIPVGKIESIVDHYARDAGLSWIGGGVALERGHWGPIFPAAGCPCYRCASDTPIQRTEDSWIETLPLVRSVSSFGPSNAIVAGMMARDALVWLLRDHDADRGIATIDRLSGRRVVDLLSMTITPPAPIRCRRTGSTHAMAPL